MALENFSPNTLIIPMDTTYQDSGMYLAYGLVYRLLTNGIPVKWAILPGKAWNGTDFTASAVDLQLGTTITSHPYSGGPFIIDSTYYNQALPIIQAWQSANPNTKVHRATSPFSAPIAATMNRRPVIAVEETNSGIVTGYLDAAKIPDSNGNTWPNNSPDILSASEIGAGAYFSTPPQDPCRQLKYDIFLSPHTDDKTWTDPTNAAALDNFVKIGGMIHAMCHSMSAIENFAGPFLTTSGFTSFANKGDTGSFTVDVPAFPTTQAVNTAPNRPQALPGGSEQTWLHTSVTYLPSTQVLAHFTNNNLQYDFMVAGSYKGGTGAGKIEYEGGHQYATTLPYSNNPDGPYLRFFYDAIFFAISKPTVKLITIPKTIPAGITTNNLPFAIVNTGGSDAVGASFSLTLAPWACYNVGSASVPPTSVTGGPCGETVTWSAAALAGHTGPGTMVTFTANATPPATGYQAIAQLYMADYSDNFNETYSLDYCTSIQALPGPLPVVVKTPLNQSVNPNGAINWNITVANNGTANLNNIVVTDTLPAGLTFVSAVPAPSSVVGGGVNPTTITWQSPQIPATLLPGGSFNITLTATAPPATTATFTNDVLVTGTNGGGQDQFSAETTATVQVNNRPPTATLVSPNGGELLCQGTTIQWNASDPDGDPLTYTLQYSADGGANYTTIVTGLTGSCPPPGPPYCSYFWDTTVLPSGSNYLVKIIASDGELTGEDVSNAPFTIDNTPPTVSWVFPTNGSFLTTTPVALQASATDNVSIKQVEFFYSSDGINFTSISTDNIASGTIYTDNWEVTGLPQGAYILRATATDQCNKTTNAEINVTMDLPPTVNLLTPQAGDLVCPQGTTITWTASDPNGDPLTFTLRYSSNGGVTYTQIATGLTGNSYSWNTTGLPSGNNYFVQIAASDGMLTATDANGPFTIDNTPPDVTWVSPTNGALLTSTPVTLQAMATDNVAVQQVQFQYSSDGVTFTNINGPVLTPTTDSIYTMSWDFSALTGGQYYLRAISTDTCNQTNQATIRVTADLPPTVSVLTPQAGQLICPNGTTITWNASSPSGRPLTFTLYYSSDGGVNYTQLASGLTGNSFSWDTTGLISGNNYFIKVVASDGILTSQAVSGPFTIDNTPPIVNFIAPTNGALLTTSPFTLQAGATDNVAIQSVQFQYSTDGTTYNNIDGPILTPTTDAIYTYSWNFSSLTPNQLYLRAVATDTCGETSNATIRVTVDLPPTVNLLTPQAGDLVCPNGTTITWEASHPNGAPLTYTLYYSANGGLTYTQIVTNLTGTSYNWNTTGLTSGSNYFVKIVASDGVLTAEDINGPFTIDNTPPSVNFITPHSGDLITSSPVTLEASATDNVAVKNVQFQYSTDGLTFTDINGPLTLPTTDAIYSIDWDFSVLPKGQYYLRAVASDTCNETANATIRVTVDLPPTTHILGPNGGEIICPNGTNITWTAFDPNGDALSYSLLYSADGGASYTIIVTGLTGACLAPIGCSFFWDTSGLPSGSDYLVKVVASDGILTAEDVSDSTFTIDNTPPNVSIISPLTNTFAHNTVTIEATASDNISVAGVTFEYSNDNGATYHLIGTVNTPLGNIYAINWNTLLLPEGPYKIRATAFDQCNNSATSIIDVTVDNTPPTVAIESPPNNSEVSGEVPLLIHGEDNECLAKVDLYIDGVLVHTENVNGGKVTDFIYDWDTTQFTEGPHTVTAVATDCAGFTATTTNIYIVNNLPDHYAQTLVDGTLTIPPQKPDVERILNLDVSIASYKTSIINTIDGSKVIVKGFVEIGVTYSTDGDQEEHFAEFKVPFHAMVIYPGLPLDANIEVVFVVEHKQWHLLDPRTIKKDIVLFVGIKQVC